MTTTGQALLERVRDSVIGDDLMLPGPFGPRRCVYADYTASGRALSFIEDVIREQVLPWYANTHTESSATGQQTGRLREQARQVLHRAVGADDAVEVLFCGSGTTAAIDKLIRILGLRLPAELDERWGLSGQIGERPVVFLGPYEHHSNELPWRESIADVVVIGEDERGHIDTGALEAGLRAHQDRKLKIGSFSAASNVTGVLSDVPAITRLLHDHGALAFWDYAAAAPYVPMSMVADDLDAVFLSPHKLVGGPGTPGVLAVRRALLTNRIPTVPGGGTVSYVNPTDHRYLDDLVAREEAGTPAIVESIRAALAFLVKEQVGTGLIAQREHDLLERAMTAWLPEPRVEVLGRTDVPRLSIVSFLVRGSDGRYLHHNLVVALLNDLFGIQARGGCSCAGPYGHRLLGIDTSRSEAFRDRIEVGCDGVKPGWVRLSFNYFLSDTVADYLIAAVQFIAEHGERFVPLYTFDPFTGLWAHPDRPAPFDLTLDAPPAWQRADESVLAQHLADAAALIPQACPEPVHRQLHTESESLRWFAL